MSRSRAVALTVSTLLLCAGLTTAAGAATTPCAAGTPLEGDFDGDGRAELVVGAMPFTSTSSAARHWVQDGDGSTSTWVDGGALRSGDLNGDVCADAVIYDGGNPPRLQAVLGTPGGLDLDGATDVEVPQAADLTSDDRELVLEAAILRHDGLSQIVIAGHHTWEEGSERYGGYVDVLTLGPDLAVAETQVIAFPGIEGEIIRFGVLVTSGSTVAVGAPAADVNGHSGAGVVRLYTPDAADPNRLVLRKVLSQDSSGVPGVAEAFDGFGSSLAMRDGRLAIGAPGESDGRLPRTGLTASGSYDVVIGADEAYGSLQHAGSVCCGRPASSTRS